MSITRRCVKTTIVGGLALAQALSHAAPYTLAQEPRNPEFKEPAPNVIVSVDNSGSMSYSSRASDGNSSPPEGVPTRLKALQNALKSNFSETAVPEGRIRLAWQAMNHHRDSSCVGFFGDAPTPPYKASPCLIDGLSNANLMRPLDVAHRAKFISWVDSLSANGNTPLHAMMARAGEYMKTEGRFSPYSDDPGVEGASQSSCRKSFHIFMTDGEYNLFELERDPALHSMPAIGNADGTARSLPDGVNYQPLAPYKDDVGALNKPANWERIQGKDPAQWRPRAEYRPTLADMAFHYWATDLQPDLANRVRKKISEAGTAKVVAEAQGVVVATTNVPEYWNPRNNPATWQHLSTHTIGFGSASSWSGRPSIASDQAKPTYSGDYGHLVGNKVNWADPLTENLLGSGFQFWRTSGGAVGYLHTRSTTHDPIRMDLWHAAINGRGSFTPAANAEALSEAFKSILAEIALGASTPLTSIAANSSKVSSDTIAFQTGYDTLDWSGTLTASKFDGQGQVRSTSEWSAGALLDTRMATAGAHRSRQVLSFARNVAASGETPAGSGAAFRWNSLSDAQKDALKSSTGTNAEMTAHGQAVLDFLRGDRSNEGSAGWKLRKREHVLGDIVNSSAWYVGQPRSGFVQKAYAKFSAVPRTPMVYVGANDGMLHGFNASSGQEVFAYVPEGLFGSASEPLLKRLSEPGYAHRYYVDGSPFVADIYMGSATDTSDEQMAGAWKSLLVGTLGAGGKGYFVLDVTQPQAIDEAHAADVVWIDTTASSDRDLGHQFQQPSVDSFPRRALQVTTLNNGRRALVLGNGYNSASEKAFLWIQYLDGSRSVLKIAARASQENGTGNGLSAPQLVDRDGDGKVDFAYAGDLLGNLWKFDLSDPDSTKWKATLGSGATTSSLDNIPLFAAGATHPIAAAPVVVPHPLGGAMVVFGTGRLFAIGDENNTAQQYIFGIWDKANGSTGTAVVEDLVAQTVSATTVSAGDDEYRTVSTNEVTYSGPSGRRGWYIALPSSKERIVYPGDVLRNRIGLFSSTIPGTSSNAVACTPGTADDGWTMLVDFFTGTAPSGIVYSTLVANGSYLGYRNHTGRDDVGFRGGDGGISVRNADGKGKDPDVPSRIHRFGWRSLISSQ